jgi:hypothetical protein
MTTDTAATIACRDYSAHQTRHQWLGGRWVCLECEPDERVLARADRELIRDEPPEGGSGS